MSRGLGDVYKRQRQYNVKITGFPAVIFAKLFGFDKRPQFQASEEAQAAPSVQF